ncbi:MAG: class I SAM-dependent methyltransferase [Ruminococcaceae bacterium]|nr:class I SAM-dependent methyltransferase [Oscillospiraceae bacterium]
MYQDFSYYYDQFAYDIDYGKFYRYYKKIFEKFSISPKLILDICCGTGTLTRLMAKDYEMIGVDYSWEMLDVAREKDPDNTILYLNQSMTDFELYGTVDVCYSSLDSVNYLLSKEDLIKHFKLVHNYLNPDGLYIFDISTIYKFRHILGNNTFTDETETEFFVWQNNYEDRLLTMDLDIFYQEENGSYGRVSETHYERGYTISEISKVAEKCGFKVEGVFDEFSFKPAHAKSERIFFVIRSIKK